MFLLKKNEYIDTKIIKGNVYEYYIQVEGIYGKKSIPSAVQKISI